MSEENIEWRQFHNKSMTEEEFEEFASKLYTKDYMMKCNYSAQKNTNFGVDTQFATMIELIFGNSGNFLIGGCGCGSLVHKLREKNINAWGFDISDAIEDATHNFGCGEFLKRGSVYNIPKFGVEFDYYITADVLEHVPYNLLYKAVEQIELFKPKMMFHAIGCDDISDGGNPGHITLKNYKWWVDLFSNYQDVTGRFLRCELNPRGWIMGSVPGAIIYERKEVENDQ